MKDQGQVRRSTRVTKEEEQGISNKDQDKGSKNGERRKRKNMEE